ncbi:hypothetical protein Hdeb2414_s0008g00287391 [Helianthus debilis subsp. tardiflorus]
MEMAWEKIMSINQEDTVHEYCAEFEFLFDQVRNFKEISEFYAIYLFICGLEPEIRKIFARWHQYSCTKVKDVISLALKIDSNSLQDSFSPFDPNSSFYNKDLEFDINITLEELMKDNELFRDGKIQETIDGSDEMNGSGNIFVDESLENEKDEEVTDSENEIEIQVVDESENGVKIQEPIDQDSCNSEDSKEIEYGMISLSQDVTFENELVQVIQKNNMFEKKLGSLNQGMYVIEVSDDVVKESKKKRVVTSKTKNIMGDDFVANKKNYAGNYKFQGHGLENFVENKIGEVYAMGYSQNNGIALQTVTKDKSFNVFKTKKKWQLSVELMVVKSFEWKPGWRSGSACISYVEGSLIKVLALMVAKKKDEYRNPNSKLICKNHGLYEELYEITLVDKQKNQGMGNRKLSCNVDSHFGGVVDKLMQFGKVKRPNLGINFVPGQSVEQSEVSRVLVSDAPPNSSAGNGIADFKISKSVTIQFTPNTPIDIFYRPCEPVLNTLSTIVGAEEATEMTQRIYKKSNVHFEVKRLAADHVLLDYKEKLKGVQAQVRMAGLYLYHKWKSKPRWPKTSSTANDIVIILNQFYHMLVLLF